jgi:hypothetical protein
MQTLRETYGGDFLKTSEPCELFTKLSAVAQSWLPLARREFREPVAPSALPSLLSRHDKQLGHIDVRRRLCGKHDRVASCPARAHRGQRGKIMQPLLGRAQVDERLREAVKTCWVEPRRQIAREIVRRPHNMSHRLPPGAAPPGVWATMRQAVNSNTNIQDI